MNSLRIDQVKGESAAAKALRGELKGVDWLQSKYKISAAGDLLNYFTSKDLNCPHDSNNSCTMERLECFHCFRRRRRWQGGRPTLCRRGRPTSCRTGSGRGSTIYSEGKPYDQNS